MCSEAEDVLIETYFNIFDKNSDGKMNNKELKKMLTVLYKGDISDSNIQELLKEFDDDVSGQLELNEFKKLYRSLNDKVQPKGESLKEMFCKYDKNKDGSLSKSEVRKFLEDLEPGREITENCVDMLMRKTDVNNDGSVSFGEFVLMFVLLETDSKQRT